MEAFHVVWVALRRPACNKCLTAVDMFVYIAARERKGSIALCFHMQSKVVQCKQTARILSTS